MFDASGPALTTTEKEALDNGCPAICIHSITETSCFGRFRPATAAKPANGLSSRVVLPRRLDPELDR
jgi:hypothetical protein